MNSSANRTNFKGALPEVAKYLLSLVILLGAAGIMFWLYSMRETNAKSENDVLVPSVDVATVELFEGDIDLEVSGTVVPFREIRVGAEVTGVIAKKDAICEAGNFVKQGTVLLEIDPRDYKLEIKTLESEKLQARRTMDETEEEIRGADKNLELAQTDLKLQQREFKRMERLRGSVSSTEMDQAQRALLNSQSQLTLRQNSYDMLLKKKERLKSSMDLIGNRMERAELNLERTFVRAPSDGVIVQENVEQGDFVSVGRDLFLFECTACIEVSCNLTPGELSWIRKYAKSDSDSNGDDQIYGLPKLQVELFEQTNPAVKWTGILERIDGFGLTETTKSVPCSIVVQQPVVEDRNGYKKALVRGMYLKCRMVLPVRHLKQQLASFPSPALQPDDYVWAVRDEKLNRFEVQVVDRSPPPKSHGAEPRVIVELVDSGMAIGELLVTSPLPQPTIGGRVQLNKPMTTGSGELNEGSDAELNAGKDVMPNSETHTSTIQDDSTFNERSEP